MNRDDIIRMAREAGATPYTNRHYPDRPTHTFNPEQLERFAALVAAAERESWPAEMEAMERQVNILTDELTRAKAAEREACIQVIKQTKFSNWFQADCIETIRARNQV